MTDKEKLELIEKALDDVNKESLSMGAFFYVVGSIIHGFGELTDADIAWGKDVVRQSLIEEQKPDSSIKPPKYSIVTEGYDPKKVKDMFQDD
jgi:hypothetical protein